jgi:ABC-type sugar transport system permease subunit
VDGIDLSVAKKRLAGGRRPALGSRLWGRGPLRAGEERLAWTMLLPALLALLALGVYPAVTTLWLSFRTGGTYGIGMSMAGFSNYVRLLGDHQFRHDLLFSLSYSVVTVAGQMVLGTLLAVFANQKIPARWLVRAAILFPWAIPTATNSVIWAYMFNDQYGLFNSILIRLGLVDRMHPIVWLGSARLATALIFILAIWKANSLVALLVLAGLQLIPNEVYETAQVDGAGKLQTFWHVTLPLLRPTLVVVLILRTIESLQAFDLISAFTNGAPGNQTENLGLYIYTQIAQFGDFGYGSTIAAVVMVMTLAFIIIYLRTLYRPGTA